MGYKRRGRSELRCTVIAVEDRVASVHVLQKLGPSSFSKLVLDVGKPVADGGHGKPGELGDVHPLLRPKV